VIRCSIAKDQFGQSHSVLPKIVIFVSSSTYLIMFRLEHSPTPSTSGEEPSSAAESSGDDEEPTTRPRAYNLLLESFGQDVEVEERSRKRRKVERDRSASVASVVREEDSSDAGEEADDIDDKEGLQVDFDDDEDASDPYEAHFANPGEDELAQKLKAVAANQWSTARQQFGAVGKCSVCMPGAGIELQNLSTSMLSGEAVKLKKKLLPVAEKLFSELDSTQKPFASNIFAYRDVLFGGRTVQNASMLRKLTCLHALNLVFKTRDRVLKNNARLAKDNSNPDIEYRDQGFTRPKVLILLPTRQSCVRLMDTLLEIWQPEQQENKKRFEDSFDADADSHHEKPEDYRELFEGNTDDMFRLGIKFTRKTLKFFSPFYSSDIIIASPLGLRTALESSEKKKKEDYDFLSSIEIVIMDQTDALLMGNWDHVEYIFSHLNLQPQEAHGCDFSRVRSWYLDGNARNLRQTIILSAYITPTLNTLFNKHLTNIAGKVKYNPEYKGAMANIGGLSIKQTFTRFDSPSIVADPDARFKYFTTSIVPSVTRFPKPLEGGLGILIFIPSYFDFVRVRNFFANSSATQNVSFGSISENAEPSNREIRRAQSHFNNGKHSVLLYSGRAHHFFRYKIRGVRKVIMYGLPDNPIHYEELAGGFVGATLDEGNMGAADVGVRVLFSKYDFLELERVVGSTRVTRLVRDKGDTFDFV
jgi:U3 small nucleolar RNA-associated protein 25